MDSSNKPLVSIVFTSYNHKEYLRQALNSLISQTYENIEIIIIDDCSTDGSQDVLKEYANYPKINLQLQTVNSGSYVKASNYGATFAKGEYVLFAQCDDFAEPNQIEELVKPLIENKNIGVCYSMSNLVDKNGAILATDFSGRERAFKKTIKNSPFLKSKETLKFLSFACVIPNLSAAIVRRELLEEVGCLSEKFIVVADWELWISLAKITDFYVINKPLNNFRQHDTTIRSKVKMGVQIQEVYSMFYHHIQSGKLNPILQKDFKIGAGAVWFTYFFMNKRLWIQSFLNTYASLRKYEAKPVYFLILGFYKHLIEAFFRRFVNK